MTPKYLFWVDLESTGLNPKTDFILEISYIISEFNYPYKLISEDTHLILGNGRDLLLNSNTLPEEIIEMHRKSGLSEDLRDISRLVTVSEVEQRLLTFSFDWPTPDRLASSEEKSTKVCIAGNSCHFDLGFIRNYMPEFAKRLSYRTFDVRAISMFCESLGMVKESKESNSQKVEVAHRAKEDIQYSINHARECNECLNKHFISKVRLLDEFHNSD
jgi:oligoribonuclease